MNFASLKKRIYETIFELDTPHHIALSFSIGLFFGFIPLLGLQLLPLFAIMFYFKLNKAATLAGHLLMNSFTFPLVYAFCFFVGALVTGEGLGQFFSVDKISFAYLLSIYKPLFIGCMVVGAIVSFTSYFAAKYFVTLYRVKHKKKLEKKRLEKELKKRC